MRFKYDFVKLSVSLNLKRESSRQEKDFVKQGPLFYDGLNPGSGFFFVFE